MTSTPGRPATPELARGDLKPSLLPPPRSPIFRRLDVREVAAVFVGGAMGTLLRAALAEAFPTPATSWPWPTFAVNIVAAFLLGYFVTRLQERLPISSYIRPLLGTGLCGGLSTFSTMQIELFNMITAHAYELAISYATATIVIGYIAIHIATVAVRRTWAPR
nr:fluoride efflux transporter CrcB [Ferrimicrobium acidiphilum]